MQVAAVPSSRASMLIQPSLGPAFPVETAFAPRRGAVPGGQPSSVGMKTIINRELFQRRCERENPVLCAVVAITLAINITGLRAS